MGSIRSNYAGIPRLHCTILELPAAIDRAMALAARHGMAERLSYRAADAFDEDLGEATYDVVIANNFVHHFTRAQNFELANKVARALTPGGLYAIFELLRSDNPASAGMIATLDLYFALTSASGLFSLAEITAWQTESGLRPLKPIRFLRLPGWVRGACNPPRMRRCTTYERRQGTGGEHDVFA